MSTQRQKQTDERPTTKPVKVAERSPTLEAATQVELQLKQDIATERAEIVKSLRSVDKESGKAFVRAVQLMLNVAKSSHNLHTCVRYLTTAAENQIKAQRMGSVLVAAGMCTQKENDKGQPKYEMIEIPELNSDQASDLLRAFKKLLREVWPIVAYALDGKHGSVEFTKGGLLRVPPAFILDDKQLGDEAYVDLTESEFVTLNGGSFSGGKQSKVRKTASTAIKVCKQRLGITGTTRATDPKVPPLKLAFNTVHEARMALNNRIEQNKDFLLHGADYQAIVELEAECAKLIEQFDKAVKDAMEWKQLDEEGAFKLRTMTKEQAA